MGEPATPLPFVARWNELLLASCATRQRQAATFGRSLRTTARAPPVGRPRAPGGGLPAAREARKSWRWALLETRANRSSEYYSNHSRTTCCAGVRCCVSLCNVETAYSVENLPTETSNPTRLACVARKREREMDSE